MNNIDYDKEKEYRSEKFAKNGNYLYADSTNIESEPILYFGDQESDYIIPLTLLNFLINNKDEYNDKMTGLENKVNKDRYKISMPFVQSIAFKYGFSPHIPHEYSDTKPEKRWLPTKQYDAFSLVIDWHEEEWPANPSKRNRGGWVLRVHLPSYRNDERIGYFGKDRNIFYASWSNAKEISDLFVVASDMTKLKALIALSDKDFASDIRYSEELREKEALNKENYRKRLEERRIEKNNMPHRKAMRKIYSFFSTKERLRLATELAKKKEDEADEASVEEAFRHRRRPKARK
jgi:hypothetical protein